jgi:hypothetical protein
MPSLTRLIDDLYAQTGDQPLAEALGRLLLPVLMTKPKNRPDPTQPFKLRYVGQDGEWKSVYLASHDARAVPQDPDLAGDIEAVSKEPIPESQIPEEDRELPHPWLIPMLVFPEQTDEHQAAPKSRTGSEGDEP